MKGQILNFKTFLILLEIRNIIKLFPLVSWLAFGAEECRLVLVASDLKFKYFIEVFLHWFWDPQGGEMKVI